MSKSVEHSSEQSHLAPHAKTGLVGLYHEWATAAGAGISSAIHYEHNRLSAADHPHHHKETLLDLYGDWAKAGANLGRQAGKAASAELQQAGILPNMVLVDSEKH